MHYFLKQTSHNFIYLVYIKIINESVRAPVLLSNESAQVKVSQMQLTLGNHNNFSFPICVFLMTSGNGFPTRQHV